LAGTAGKAPCHGISADESEGPPAFRKSSRILRSPIL